MHSLYADEMETFSDNGVFQEQLDLAEPIVFAYLQIGRIGI